MQPVPLSGGNGLQIKHLNNMRKFFAGFRYAFAGVCFAFKHERNFKIELLCAIAVSATGFIFHISRIEWCIILVNIGAVLSAELFNTAIEKMCNEFSKEIRRGIKAIKDVSAAAVLIFAIISVVCGLIIFVPYFLNI